MASIPPTAFFKRVIASGLSIAWAILRETSSEKELVKVLESEEIEILVIDNNSSDFH